MSSRFSHNDSRYIPRDRSPPRHPDRRPSVSYNTGPSFRDGEYVGRQYPDSVGRSDIPRGPRALTDHGVGPPAPSGPRGRGFAGRVDFRELRDAPPLSDSRDRSWRDDDLDRRDRRPSPRARTPPKGRRNSREYLPRELDIGRARRASRDGPPSAGSNFSDPPRPTSYGRGGFGRGRGRGDWEYRGRGRGSHLDDREPLRRRSRSPEPRFERDRSRDSRDVNWRDDHRAERHDEDRRPYRDERESDRFKRDQISNRVDARAQSGVADSRPVAGTSTGQSTPHQLSVPNDQDAGASRAAVTDNKRDREPPRRRSVIVDSTAVKDTRREPEKPDYIASRAEASRERYGPRASSPPPSAPQVPAFGYSYARPSSFNPPTSNVWKNPHLENKPPAKSAPLPRDQPESKSVPPNAQVLDAPQPPKIPPSAPKAHLLSVPPTGPKAARIPERPSADLREPNTIKAEPQVNKDVILSLQNMPQASLIHEQGNLEVHSAVPLRTGPSPVPPAAPAAMQWAPPTGPQSSGRPVVPPSQNYNKPPQGVLSGREVSPANAVPLGPRMSLPPITSPKSIGANVPTGPKAERVPPMAPRAALFGNAERPPQFAPRAPMMGTPGKNLQWIRPGAPNYGRPPITPAKRELSGSEKESQPGYESRTLPSDQSLFASEVKKPRTQSWSQGTDWRVQEKSALDESVSAASTTLPEHPKIGQHDVLTAPVPISSRVENDTKETHNEPSTGVQAAVETTRKYDEPGIGEITDTGADLQQASRPSTPEAPDHMSEDEAMNFDEEDFAKTEATFNREKALLEAKMLDLSDRKLRATTPLEKIAWLSSITVQHLPSIASVDGADEMSSVDHVEDTEAAKLDILTPKREVIDDVIMDDGIDGREFSFDREPSPDISSLPFIPKGPPTPVSEIGKSTLAQSEAVKEVLNGHLLRLYRAELDLRQDETLQYIESYRSWVKYARELDEAREKAEKATRQSSAEAGVALSEAAAATTPAAAPEGRRARQFLSEYEFQQWLDQTRKDEEEAQARREGEAQKAKTDVEREAPDPCMLRDVDSRDEKFIDTNRQRHPARAAIVFDFEPAVDDFTEEEHKVMVQNYKEYPKKWGKIAQGLPGRSYQACINHYYATKWGGDYKVLKDRRRAKGKGSRKAGAQPRNRTNAITSEMSAKPDVYEGDEFAAPVAAVTDSGRPRRAAAPTWPSKDSESEQNAPMPTPGRKPGAMRTEVSGEQGADKPRKQRVAKEKKPRKPRNQPLAARPALSPQKTDPDRRDMSTLGEADWAGSMNVIQRDDNDGVPQLHPQMSDEDQALYRDNPFTDTIGATAPVGRPRPQGQQQRAGPSSYWSVQEHNDFRKYLCHFGTDFPAIANHMGSKTQTMVRNMYQRWVERGENPEIVAKAKETDKRRERGEELGPPPAPSTVNRRRYDNSGPTVQRPLAPNTEIAELQNSPPSEPSLPVHLSPPAYHSQARLSALSQASISNIPSVATSQAAFQSSHGAPLHTVHSQQQRATQHLQGPRLGFFADTRGDGRATLQSHAVAKPSQQMLEAQHLAQQRRLSVAAPRAPSPPTHEQAQPAQRLRRDYLNVQSPNDHSVLSEYASQHRQLLAAQHERELQQQREQHHHISAHSAPFGPHPTQHTPVQSLRSIQPEAGSGDLRAFSLQNSTVQARQPHLDIQNLVDTNTRIGHPSVPPEMASRLPRLPPQPQAREVERPEPIPVQAPSQVAPAPRPIQETRKTSNIMSILNSDPEEPRVRRAEPEPTPQSVELQRPGSRAAPSQQHQLQASTVTESHASIDSIGRDYTNTVAQRESWPPRKPISQASPQTTRSHSPQMIPTEVRSSLHRAAAFGALQQTRHVPSPPPAGQFPPSSHTRTASWTLSQSQHQPQPQQPAQNPPNPHQTQPPGPTQILQQNPYAQLQPPQSQQGPSTPLQQQIQRNEEAHRQNQGLAYPLQQQQQQQQQQQPRPYHEHQRRHSQSFVGISGGSGGLAPQQPHHEPLHRSMVDPIAHARTRELEEREREREREREQLERQRHRSAFTPQDLHQRYSQATPQPHEQQPPRFPPPPPRTTDTPTNRLAYAPPEQPRQVSQQPSQPPSQHPTPHQEVRARDFQANQLFFGSQQEAQQQQQQQRYRDFPRDYQAERERERAERDRLEQDRARNAWSTPQQRQQREERLAQRLSEHEEREFSRREERDREEEVRRRQHLFGPGRY